MAPPATAINRGWTLYGRAYHIADDFGPHFRFLRKCDNGWIDQTELRRDGEPTGALVPEDLRPCKRCFKNGDQP